MTDSDRPRCPHFMDNSTLQCALSSDHPYGHVYYPSQGHVDDKHDLSEAQDN